MRFVSPVAIQGDGIAACCCARLLSARGIPLVLEKSVRPKLPSLLVSAATQQLIADVFEDGLLFTGFAPIRKRIVRWCDQPSPVTLDHEGLVVSESGLLERLWSKIHLEPTSNETPETANWRVLSARAMNRGVENGHIRPFGTRTATASTVRLRADTGTEACWVEALDAGWLFLVPTGELQGSLIAVGGTVAALLDESRLIAKEIEGVLFSSAKFPAYPRILDPLCGPGWLACGTNAMGFDPICGEGAGNAVREAILVSAALAFLEHDSEFGPVLEHYSARLLGGFLKHLLLCKNFYSGIDRPWWKGECHLLDEGIDWTQKRLRSLPGSRTEPCFRLVNFDLQRTA